MKLMRFWRDLSMWNKFGISFVLAVSLLLLIVYIVD